jgi:hypothetical protein
MPEPSEARTEIATMRPREIADPDARRVRMRRRVVAQHPQERPNQAPVPVAPPTAVRRALAHRVPREEVLPFGREPDTADERAVPREAERPRARIGAGRAAREGQRRYQAKHDLPQGHVQTYAESIA